MVAITYVTNGAWGTGQGSALPAATIDRNFYNVALAIAAAEAEIDAIISVSSISSSGNIVTFHLTNGSTVDVAFSLPSFRYRGAWLNSTPYAVGDIVTVASSGTYLCAVAHDSAASPATFNPEAADSSTDGAGEERLWTLLLPEPDLTTVMRWKGSSFPASQTLEENDVFWDSTYGLFVVNSDHTSAATFDPVAVDGSSNALYTKVAAAPFSPVSTVTGVSYTISRDDVGKYLRFTNASGCTIFFEDDAFDVGEEIHFEQAGAGSLIFTAASTDTNIRPQRIGYDTATPYEGAVVTAKVVAADDWKLVGPHGAVLTA